QRLPPEQGTRACAQQALSALVEIVRCRGAAILLADGDAISQGAIQLDPLRRGWVRETRTDPLPGRVLAGYDLAALSQELREVVGEAGVSAVLAVRSPRRHSRP